MLSSCHKSTPSKISGCLQELGVILSRCRSIGSISRTLKQGKGLTKNPNLFKTTLNFWPSAQYMLSRTKSLS
ncbi:unnamed protein product [Meloidogyne enterolobii]|uniref:Uncharacterized protein n=1 Tax=Meloidogyne enterolobii TaxID=390850 RepID=A0ACB0YUH0_MELEN